MSGRRSRFNYHSRSFPGDDDDVYDDYCDDENIGDDYGYDDYFAKAIQAEGWLHFNYLFNFDIGLCANCKGAVHTILGKQKIFHFELNQNCCFSINQGGKVK